MHRLSLGHPCHRFPSVLLSRKWAHRFCVLETWENHRNFLCGKVGSWKKKNVPYQTAFSCQRNFSTNADFLVFHTKVTLSEKLKKSISFFCSWLRPLEICITVFSTAYVLILFKWHLHTCAAMLCSVFNRTTDITIWENRCWIGVIKIDFIETF